LIRDSDVVLLCEKCGHLWWEKVDLPMRLEAFALRLKGFGICPECAYKPRRGAKKTILLLQGDRRKEAVAQLDNSSHVPA
jgi:hypothetical protein